MKSRVFEIAKARSAGRGIRSSWFLICLLPVLGACDPLAEIRGFLGIGQKAMELPSDMKSEMNAANSMSQSAAAGNIAKENQELLAEILRVVFDREDSEDQADFESLVRTLNQGASLEGIYRGIIMGSRYRALESKSQAATPGVLRVFATELAEIQDGMREPTRFDPELARQVPRVDFPEDVIPGAVSRAGSATPEPVQKKRPDKNRNFQELMRTFVGASPYTLKRILGEEALRRFDEAGDDPSAVPLWYAELAVRLSSSNVDFGLPLRNKGDYAFHKNFAQKIARDRVKWEVLNRYHRYLNAAIKASG
jgi:hypothetical protein